MMIAAKLIALHYFPQLLESPTTLPFTFFFVLVVNSFCEEYVFRGILMQYLELRWTLSQAICLQSLFFAVSAKIEMSYVCNNRNVVF
jgi:membrane protease YdiL (CAAX protease family)